MEAPALLDAALRFHNDGLDASARIYRAMEGIVLSQTELLQMQ